MCRFSPTGNKERQNDHAMMLPVKLLDRLSGDFSNKKRNSTDNPLANSRSEGGAEHRPPRHGTDTSGVSQGSAKSGGGTGGFARRLLGRAVKKGAEGLKRVATAKKRETDESNWGSEATDSVSGMSDRHRTQPRAGGRSRVVSVSVGGVEVNLVHGQSISESALLRKSSNATIATRSGIASAGSALNVRDNNNNEAFSAHRAPGGSVYDVSGERKVCILNTSV
jgi:hypothetical protein